MSSDTKFLKKQGDTWHIRVARPPKCWGLKGEFWQSLHTCNLTEARKLRDRFLLPVLAASSAPEMVRTLLSLMASADEEVQVKLNEMSVYLGNKKLPTICELFELYIRRHQGTKVAPKTIETYRSTRNTYAKLNFDLPIDTLTAQDMIKFRDKALSLRKGWHQYEQEIFATEGQVKLSPNTVNIYLMQLRTVWGWAVKDGKIPNLKCPAKDVTATVKSRNKSVRLVTFEEAEALSAMPYDKSEHFDELAWVGVSRIARYSGMRIAEICQLRSEDIQEHSGILCFSVNDYGDKSTKNVSSVRLVPIADKLLPLVESLKEREGLLFPRSGKYGGRYGFYLSRTFSRKAKKVGDHLKFHSFRSYAITQMANAGIPEIDRKRIAGHSDRSVHSGYTGDDLQRYKKAVDQIK